MQGDLKLLLYRATALRDEQDSGWRDVVAETLRLHPDDPKAKALQAEGISNGCSRLTPARWDARATRLPTPDELMAAADSLKAMWNTTTGGETPPMAALVRHFLGQDGRAEALLDAVLAAGFVDDETKRLRISLYMRAGKTRRQSGSPTRSPTIRGGAP